jgi:IS5 family transposase
MRIVQSKQPQLGSTAIADIQFDLKSRDDIPQILRGLQYIYVNTDLRNAVFNLLETHIQPDADQKNGRPGMNLWNIFVLGVLRLDLNWDYDCLHEQANNHKTIRQMLGHADIFDAYHYNLQTLKDNVRLLTPELLDEINKIVVASGHAVLKKKKTKRCVVAAIPLWLKPMCIIQRTSIYCLMRCAKLSYSLRVFVAHIT